MSEKSPSIPPSAGIEVVPDILPANETERYMNRWFEAQGSRAPSSRRSRPDAGSPTPLSPALVAPSNSEDSDPPPSFQIVPDILERGVAGLRERLYAETNGKRVPPSRPSSSDGMERD